MGQQHFEINKDHKNIHKNYLRQIDAGASLHWTKFYELDDYKGGQDTLWTYSQARECCFKIDS